MASNEADSDGEQDTGTDSKFFTYDGPRDDINYPISVIYCGECSMPVEYCEYHPSYDRCKKWMEKNLPEELQQMLLGGEGEVNDGEGAKKKRQSRGGRGVIKARKKTEPQQVSLFRANRGKKKYVTVITGLATYDIDLKDASKYFANKFSCGSSVTGEDEIVIQGDVKDELFDLITEKWTQISEDNIEDKGDMKRS